MRKQPGFSTVELLVVLVMLAMVGVVGWQAWQRLSKAKSGTATNTAATVQTKVAQRGALKGISLSPRTFGAADFSAFFGEVPKNGALLSWAGSWTDLEATTGAPYTVTKLASQYHYQPVVIAGTHHDAGGKVVATLPLTDADKARFVAALSAFAAAQKPAYMGIGNEVNRIHDDQPQDYAAFKGWFDAAARAVHAKSPATKVFVTFQYEQLNGLYGGLFGGQNNPASANWQLLDDFPSADLVAFTTYPYLIYKDPADIPDDYYSRAASHTTKPVGFSEVGWPSSAEAAGYDSSPEEQAQFIHRFTTLNATDQLSFVIWPFLYDQAVPKPFASLGLVGSDNVPKPALTAWQQATFGK